MQEFRSAVQSALAEDALLPLALVHACVTTLPVEGAGITITGQLRIPLASSSPDAACAESLQTTIGEGPCLTAAATDTASITGLTEMNETWPIFTTELVKHTPYRSIASVPLGNYTRSFGAIDLYSTRSTSSALNDISHQLIAIGFEVTDSLAAAMGTAPAAIPGLLDNPATSQRMRVWAAQGMVVSHARVSASDAIAALRAYAYGHGTTLDDAAAQLTDNRIHARDILPA